MLDNPHLQRLLARQFGVVTIAQLLEFGSSRRSISHAVERGVLAPILPGVFRVTGYVESYEALALAVQFHTAPDGALGGPTAGRLRGMRQMPSRRLYVVSARRTRTKLPAWVAKTETSWIDPHLDVVIVGDVFRVLRPEVMLLTLAELFNDFRFERAAEDAWHLDLVTPDTASAWLAGVRRQGRSGIARMERWLAKTGARARPSQSGFELDVLDTLRAVGLPEPERQHPVTLTSGEVVHLDFAWPDVTLGVEPGHSWWHNGDLGVQADQARDLACGEVGWHVIRFDESARADLAGVCRKIRATYLRRAVSHADSRSHLT